MGEAIPLFAQYVLVTLFYEFSLRNASLPLLHRLPPSPSFCDMQDVR
jgi:hypothetical protein